MRVDSLPFSTLLMKSGLSISLRLQAISRAEVIDLATQLLMNSLSPL